MKIILCGYHWSGCMALRILRDIGAEVFVYTHQAEWHTPDLEALCQQWGIPYSLQKVSIKNIPFKPDVICSVYYRNIIPKDIIELVDGKIFNLHPSLLPKYRGCSSLTWAMINGESNAGYTFHYINEKCDDGDIIYQETIQIEDWDTQGTLYLRVMFEAMKQFKECLFFVLEKRRGEKQVGEISYYGRGCPHNGEISQDWSLDKKRRFIRAMIYPPYKPAQYQGRQIYRVKELIS